MKDILKALRVLLFLSAFLFSGFGLVVAEDAVSENSSFGLSAQGGSADIVAQDQEVRAMSGDASEKGGALDIQEKPQELSEKAKKVAERKAKAAQKKAELERLRVEDPEKYAQVMAKRKQGKRGDRNNNSKSFEEECLDRLKAIDSAVKELRVQQNNLKEMLKILGEQVKVEALSSSSALK